jgi:DNA-binding NarL/FixJ family response regulator
MSVKHRLWMGLRPVSLAATKVPLRAPKRQEGRHHIDRGVRTRISRYVHGVPVRMVIADDSLLLREGLRELLASVDGIEVAAACEDLPSLLDAVEATRPDVVLTDIRMPPSRTDEGIQAATALRESHPDVGVIVLSQFDDPGYALALLRDGSDRRGYMLKERIHDRGQLTSVVEAVAEGGSFVDPKVVESLVAARARADSSPLSALSPREQEVLAEIAHGKSNAAIAESLVLTKRAVEKHINAIFVKLDLSESEDVSKRVKAALLFLAEERTSAS